MARPKSKTKRPTPQSLGGWFTRLAPAEQTGRPRGKTTRLPTAARIGTLRLEPLESRQLLSTTYYANDNWHDVNLGTLSVGDPVNSSNDTGPLIVATYGVNAFGTTDSPSGPQTLAGFSTINDAIAAATTGDTISVLRGTYTQNVVLSKQLTLEGAQAGVDARGRVVGSPSATSESIIAPTTGRPLELQDPADNATVDGFAIVASTSSGGAVESTTGPTDQLQFLNNYVTVATGTATPFFLNRGALDATIDKNEFVLLAGGGSQAVQLDAPDQFQGLHFTNNNVLRSGAAGGTGLFVDGNHNVSNIGSVNTPLIKGNLFQGFSAGANLGRFAFANGEISENNFNNNTGVGLQGGIQNTLITRNTFTGTGASAQGLQLTPILADPTDATKGAFNNTVTENTFSGNPLNDIFLSDGQAPGSISTNAIHGNSLGSAVGIFYRGGETIDASQNWWGTNTAAGVPGKIQTFNNERQWFGIKNSVTGSFTLSFNGNLTAPLTTNSGAGTPSALTVQTALEGLPGIGVGNVSVVQSGSSLDVYRRIYTIEFLGALAGTNVSQLVLDETSLTGATPPRTALTTLTQGAHTLSTVDYTPWLDVGVDTDLGTAGFQGSFATLHVDDNSPQTGATGRIQEGVNLVVGSTVDVEPGIYTEDVNINKSMNLLGAQAGVDPNDGSWNDTRTVAANESIIHGAVNLSLRNDIVMDGFTVERTATNEGHILIGSGNPTGVGATSSFDIINNRFVGTRNTASPGSPWAGIHTNFLNDGTLPGAQFLSHQNRIEIAGTASGSGILVNANLPGTDALGGTTITDTYVANSPGNGFNVNRPGGFATITGNRAVNDDIFTFRANNTLISGNTVIDAPQAAISNTGGSTDWTASNNTIITPRAQAILVGSTFTVDPVTDITIQNNTVTVDPSLVGVAITTVFSPLQYSYIDLRGNMTGTNSVDLNSVTLNSNTLNPAVVGVYGVRVRGNVANLTVSNNVLNGNAVGGAGDSTVPPSSGVFVDPEAMTSSLDLHVQNNFINGWVNAVSVFDTVPGSYGGLPGGATFELFENDLSGNSGLGVKSGAGELVNASADWWGTITAAGVAGQVTPAAVDYTPWLTSGTDVGGNPADGFQGSFAVLIVDDDSPQSGPVGRINEGIALVDSGGTVRILAGTYAENVSTAGKSVTLSPGASPAQVFVSGNLTLDGDDTFLAEVNGTSPASDYDNFVVTGGVTLGGATLSLSSTGYTPVVNDTIVLVDNDASDPVSGTFAGLPQNALVTLAGWNFRVSYTSANGAGNDVVLVAMNANTVYVNDNWVIDVDNGTPTVLDNGDVVSNTGVGDDSTVTGLVFGSQAFSTVTSALTAVVNGATIYVVSGSYTETPTINKEVDLLGWRFGVDARTRSPGYDAIVTTSRYIVTANNVTIDGFTFRDRTSATTGSISASSGAQNLEIRNVIFTDTRIGVDIDSSADVELHQNLFTDAAGGVQSRKGILVSGTLDSVSIHDNLFTNNSSTDPDAAGVVMSSGVGTTVTIQDNQLYNNLVAIRLTSGGTASLTDNNFAGGTDNSTDLFLASTAGLITAFTGNDFEGNTFFIDNQSTQNLDVTAGTSNTFDEANPFRIEDHMHHRVDTDLLIGTGLITWVTGNLYVTDAGTDHSIQRGIDAASSGNTVNIETGTYTENVSTTSNSVTLAPGSSPGLVTINGNLTLDSDDTLLMEINGTTPTFVAGTDFDQFDVNGLVTLGGATLDTTGSSIVADPGDTIMIIDNDLVDPVSGTFAGLPNNSLVTIGAESFLIFYDGGDGNDVVLMNVGTFPPTVVWVDDGWSSVVSGNDADGPGGGPSMPNWADPNNGTAKGYDQFDNIQEAIDAVATGGRIYVYAGNYVQELLVDHGLSLFGAQSTFDARIARGSESNIQASTASDALIEVSAAGATIDGFTVDGLNLAVRAIRVNGVNNAVVRNNIITGAERGVQYNGDVPGNTGGLVHQNRIHTLNSGPADSYGVLAFDSSYASVTDNLMTGVDVGIYEQYFYQPNGGLNPDNVISGNEITAALVGYGTNERGTGAAATALSGNIYHILADGTGVELVNIFKTNGVTLTGETIDGAAKYGVYAFISGGSASITGGSISTTNGDADDIGVLLTNYLTAFSYAATGDGALAISGTSISDFEFAGVGVLDDDTDGAFAVSVEISGDTNITGAPGGAGVGIIGTSASANIHDNDNSIHGNAIGIYVAVGSATITNNHIYDNGIGIELEFGGTATITGNDFNDDTLGDSDDDNDVDLLLEASAGTVTIGDGNDFAGDDYYIRNLSTQDLDLTTHAGATYEGLTPGVLADDFRIEDKMFHGPDNGTSGVISWVTGTLFVSAPGTGLNDEKLQFAIDTADPGNTIRVEAGTYIDTAQILVHKSVNIIGAGNTSTIFTKSFNTGASGDPRGWWLVNAGVALNLSHVRFDGTGQLTWQAIRHKGSGTIDNVAFTEIKYNPSTSYQGTAVATLAGSDVDVTNSLFSEIGRIGVLFFGAGSTGTFQGNTYTGKGVGDWLDYGVEVGGGAVVDIIGNSISGNLGVASSDSSTSAAMLITTFFAAGSEAHLSGANVFSGNTSGVVAGFDATDTSDVTIDGGQFTNNTANGISIRGTVAASLFVENATVTGNAGTGISVFGAEALIEDTDLTGNQVGIYVDDDAVVDAGMGGNTSLGTSAGNNVLTGYTGVAGNYAIEDQNLDAQGNEDVYAINNAFGSVIPAVIEQVIFHTVDNPAVTEVFFTPAIAPPNTPFPPVVVFVDDNWAGTGTGVDADGAGGGSLGNGQAFGYDQFATIQDAVNAVAIGGEIRVYAGTYAEAVSINKSLDLLAEDFILSGTPGDASADSIVDPSVLTPVIIEISVSGVEIAGFTVEGDTTDNYGILATHATNTLTGLDIHHNAVRNLFRRGIQSDTYLAEFDIHDNVVSNVTGDAAAIAIFNFGGGGLPGTAEIHDNTITGSTVGIGGQQSAGMQVYDNTITMVAGGIGVQDSNPGTGSPPPIGATETFVNNTVTGGDINSAGLIAINTAMDVLFQDNSVTTPGLGLGAFGSFSPSTVTFDSNTVNADDIGIQVTTDTLGFNGFQDVTAVITNDNDISGAATGILVEELGGANATVTITGNDNSINGNAIGIDVNAGSATISTNHIYDNGIGVRLTNGGTASITGNDFNDDTLGDTDDDNDTDLQLTSTAGSLSVLTGNTFAGDTFFIDNLSTQDLDVTAGTGNTFDEANNFRIEDKMHHQMDDDLTFATTGRITWVATNVYVTDAGTDHSIQRGVDTADVTWTVNVEDGTYALTAAVSVPKQVTLLGAQAGVDARTRVAVPESIVDAIALSGFPSTNFAVQAGVTGVVIDGFTLQNANGSQGVGGIYLAAGSNGTTIRNNILQNNHAGIFVANNSAVNQTVIEQNLFLDNTAAGPASGHGIYADEFTTGGLQNVLIQDNKFTNTSFTLSSWGVGMSNTGASAFTDISVLNNEITNSGRGMYFFNTSSADISGNTVTGATRYAVGIFGLNGVPANSSFTVSGNTLVNNGKGVYLEGDTSADAYTGGTLVLSGNSYTTTGAELSIYNDSDTPIDATADTFNGVLASGATTAQQYVIVDTIVDAVDIGAYPTGLVLTKAGHVYVTPNSYFDDPGNGLPFTQAGTTTADIQRAVNAATSGDIVHIQSGSYTGSVSTAGKSLTLDLGASTAQITINGNLTLDSNDTLVLEINGTSPTFTPGTDYDQFVINGMVDLGGATLSASGSITAANGESVRIIDNDLADAILPSTFAGLANGATLTINSQQFQIFYDGGTGNDVVLVRTPAAPPPSVVFVDDNWSIHSNGTDADGPGGGTLGNGSAIGYDQFDTIQEAVNAVAIGGEIRVYAGTYAEAVSINKSLDLLAEDFILSGTPGDASADSIVDPSVLTPVIIEISVSGVEIAGFTVEGDTTDNYGILATHATNTLTGLDIHHNAVRNLFRRGIQSDTYLAEFDIHDNVVSNVTGDAAAIAIFNFGGGGLPGTAEIHDNTITGSTVGIGGQQSAGMQVYDNTITMVAGGIGVQDSNPGTGSPPPIGATETFVNNTVTGGDINSAGLIAINTAMDVLFQDNSVTTPGLGLGAFGSFSPSTVTFDSNTVNADDIGIQVTTDTLGFNGFQDVTAVITNDNDISGAATGILVEELGGANATVTITGNDNSINGNAIGIDVNAGSATISTNHIYDNGIGVRLTNGGTASITGNDFNDDTLGDTDDDNDTDLQLTSTAGSLSVLTGNTFAGDTFFIDNLSTQNIDVTAGTGNTFDESNNFRIEDKMHHRVDTDLAVTAGLITWVAGNLYVTNAGTDHDIQRGIDAASSGNTVNIEAGTYTGNVSTAGKAITLSPGGSPAQVTINGNLTLDSNDTLVIEINGTNPASQYDNLIVNGTVTLGNATLSASSGFSPTPISTFTIIDNNLADAVTGTFAGLPEGSTVVLSGVPFTISYVGGTGNDVTLTADTLHVTNFQTNASGFDVTFNRALTTDELNLYDSLLDGSDAAPGAWDPVDLTLVGNTVGNVLGSMVWKSATRTMSFVKTANVGSLDPLVRAGVLAADTYTVTLLSGANSFHDSFGLLDGDHNGTPGDNYTTSFVVGASSRIVSVRDFARGSGQTVDDTPATPGSKLAVRISDAASVTALDFHFTYDTALLSITGATVAPGLPIDWSVTFNNLSGQLNVSASGTTPLSGLDKAIVVISASVPNAAPYGDSEVLRLTNLEVNELAIPAIADYAIHKNVYLGDADGNGIYTGFDSALISRVVVNLDTGFNTHDWTDPVIVGDATGNGTLSGQDASYVAQKGVLLPRPEIPNLPGIVLVPGTPGVDPVLSIPDNISAVQGGSVIVPVNIDTTSPNNDSVYSASFDVTYDSGAFTFVSAAQGALWSTNWAIQSNEISTGVVRIFVYYTGFDPPPTGTGTIANLQFSVSPTATLGSHPTTIAPIDPNEGGLTWTDNPIDDGSVFVHAPGVQDTKLFYKGSSKWNVTNGATFSDDNAIAPDKTAYLPGSGTSTFAAVSSYSRGINGLMVDIFSSNPLSASDFIFKVGNNNSPSTWSTGTLAAAVTVTTRTAAGSGGSDRIELMWADNTIEKQWLQVVVKGNDALGGSNTNTGLASSYVFYFGNALGDTGTGNTGAFQVTSADEINARNNPKGIGNPATRSDVNDFNRTGLVDSADQVIARNNTTSLVNQLKFLVVGAGGPFAPDSINGNSDGIGSSRATTAHTEAASTVVNSGSGGEAIAAAANADWAVASALATWTSVEPSTSEVTASAAFVPHTPEPGLTSRAAYFGQMADDGAPQRDLQAPVDDDFDWLDVDEELLDTLTVGRASA